MSAIVISDRDFECFLYLCEPLISQQEMRSRSLRSNQAFFQSVSLCDEASVALWPYARARREGGDDRRRRERERRGIGRRGGMRWCGHLGAVAGLAGARAVPRLTRQLLRVGDGRVGSGDVTLRLHVRILDGNAIVMCVVWGFGPDGRKFMS